MGLLFSDTMLIDPMLDDTGWVQDSLREWARASDASRDGTEDEKWEKIYVCQCGAPTCRGTILAPKKKHGKK